MVMVKIRGFATNIATKMKQYFHVIGFLSTALLLLLRSMPSDNQGLETRPANPPFTIVSNGSKVIDSWRGGFALRNLVLSNSEVALVFYYAPWSAEAMDAFKEFEAAAAIMHQQVSFVSVNCWWVHGKCRRSLEFSRFPQIYLHHISFNQSILYNGPLTKEHFLHFLRKALSPVQYLGSKSEVENFLSDDQFSSLSCYRPHAMGSLRTLKRYLIVALQHLENNLVPINFGIVTDPKIAKAYHLTPGVLHIRNNMRPREVIHLKLKDSIQSIVGSLKKIGTQLISPDLHFPGSKTNHLYQTIRKGPTLVVFLSSESIEERTKYVKKIRQLIILYHHCQEEDESASHVIYANAKPSSCCQTVILKIPNTESLICSVCMAKRNELFPGFKEKLQSYFMRLKMPWPTAMPGSNFVVCTDVPLLMYNVHLEKLDVCCAVAESFYNSQKFQKYTDNNHPEIIKLHSYDYMDVSWIFTDIRDQPSIISGLSCRTNRTLEFLILDYERHRKLSENLGITSQVYDVGLSKMAAVIFDPKSEINHVMSSSSFHLENFIVNYTLGILRQNRRTSLEVDSCDSKATCIHEVTAATFDEVVLNSDKNVLLLYYAPWCISCTSVSHFYLSLADLLSSSSAVYLARIDAQANDLEIQFTVQSYPTFIFFPAKRSSYSAVFPGNLKITVANLLSFVFKHMSTQSVKQVLLNLCMYASNYPSIQHAACRKWNQTNRSGCHA